ncbi:MAG: DUF5689 domain-containing protein [Clostridium sp.]|nr:DUF5689 domain-containing protein [Prevotella sp.]MCM1428508.1 DUF5689 domain-containing protein [Clostridium sp.]MCM1475862.1 DUF5689 domain-containing protein [Muribaculaceae bacterium]
MKISIYSLFGTALAGLAMLTSCQTDYDEPGLQTPVATMSANTSIADLKDILADKSSIEIPMKDEESKTPYIIKGRVVSSDISGNIFKSLVIQDETAAIQFSINSASLYTNYRVGQEIVVNATGLWGGKYHDLVCIGAGYNEYGSLVTSRMAFSIFKEHAELNGLPNENMKYVRMGNPFPSDTPYCITINDVSKLPASGADLINMQSQLVEIPNVRFEDANGETTYAPKDESVNRNIVDAYGGVLAVRNSGMSNFFNTALPTGTGTIRGILSYYNSAWQLLIRDLNDVIFDGTGSKEKPYSVEEAIAMDNNGRFCWTSGYIVGSVKAGVSNVTSNDDIIFSSEADLDNTLVIASDKDCKDFEKCMVVSLPAGTMLREYGNLADHPKNYGKLMMINGSYNALMGMHGITDCTGGVADFTIEGLVIDGVTGQGNGTGADPYTVKFVLNNFEQEQIGVYVEGYIVGFVSGTNFADGCRFNADMTNVDYNNGNVLIADNPEINDISKVIPVKLTVADRKTLGLGNNPQALGRKVKFKGTIGTWMGVPALSSTESSELLPQ